MIKETPASHGGVHAFNSRWEKKKILEGRGKEVCVSEQEGWNTKNFSVRS